MKKEELIALYRCKFWMFVENAIKDERLTEDELCNYAGVLPGTMSRWKKQIRTKARTRAFEWRHAIFIAAACAENAGTFWLMMTFSGNSLDLLRLIEMQVTMEFANEYRKMNKSGFIADERIEVLKTKMNKHNL
ncbi:MAG: hypothetical protein ACI4LZ_07420 [Anaerovoracaceae bacterium]